MSRKSGTVRHTSSQRFTQKQGHYLAFIYVYARMFGQAPAEADMQRHFRVTPPSVHQMVLGLERDGLISRQSGVARSRPKHQHPAPTSRAADPRLARHQLVKISVTSY